MIPGSSTSPTTVTARRPAARTREAIARYDSAIALDRAGFHRLAGHWVELAPGLILAGVSDLTLRHPSMDKPIEKVGADLRGRMDWLTE